MKQSTKWWVVVLAMLLLGAVVAQVGVVPGIAYRATPLGLVAAAAALLGTMAAFAIIPLVVAAITRFHRPWVVLSLYVLCAGLAVVATHNNAVHYNAATVAQQSVALAPRKVGGDNPSGAASLLNPSPQTDRQAQDAATAHDWTENAKWGSTQADHQAQAAAFIHAHPDILYGQNAKIMAEYVQALQGGQLKYIGALRVAYGIAKGNERWQSQP